MAFADMRGEHPRGSDRSPGNREVFLGRDVPGCKHGAMLRHQIYDGLRFRQQSPVVVHDTKRGSGV